MLVVACVFRRAPGKSTHDYPAHAARTAPTAPHSPEANGPLRGARDPSRRVEGAGLRWRAWIASAVAGGATSEVVC